MVEESQLPIKSEVQIGTLTIYAPSRIATVQAGVVAAVSIGSGLTFACFVRDLDGFTKAMIYFVLFIGGLIGILVSLQLATEETLTITKQNLTLQKRLLDLTVSKTIEVYPGLRAGVVFG